MWKAVCVCVCTYIPCKVIEGIVSTVGLCYGVLCQHKHIKSFVVWLNIKFTVAHNSLSSSGCTAGQRWHPGGLWTRELISEIKPMHSLSISTSGLKHILLFPCPDVFNANWWSGSCIKISSTSLKAKLSPKCNLVFFVNVPELNLRVNA